MNILQPDTTLDFPPLARCAAFFIQFGLCGANSYLISGFARHIVGTIDRVFVFVIAFLGQVILITAFLGFAGHLNYFLIVAFLLVIFLLLRLLRSRLPLRKKVLVRSYGIKPPDVSTPFLDSPILVFLGLLVFAFVSFIFVWAVVTPPPASDAFIYHLTLPTQWMQTGSVIPDRFSPFGESFHPSNPETLLLWMLMPFHEDIFTNLISWIFWLLCAFAVYSISISLGARHRAGIAAAMLWLVLPLTSRTAASSEIDLMAAFFFLVSVLFLVRFRADRHVVFLLWGGLSLGIFLGSKLSSIAYSLPVFALYALLIFERRRKAANHIAVFLMAALLLSAFWYVCNYLATGNPFHPLQVSLLGRVLFPGAIHRTAIISSAAHNARPMNLLFIFEEIFGLYLMSVLIAVLGVAIAHKLWSRRLITSGVLLLPVVMTLLFWAIGMNKLNSARYLFPAAAIACVAWSLVVPETKSFRIIYYFITFICAAVTIAKNQYLLYTVFRNLGYALVGTTTMGIIEAPVRWLFLLCLASGTFLFFAFLVRQQIRRGCIIAATVIAAIIFPLQYPGLIKYYSAAKYAWYRPVSPGMGMAWSSVEAIHPKPLNIAVSGTNLYHGFFGVGLRNRVKKFDYDYYNDDSKWIIELQTQAIQLLAVSKVHEDLPETVYHNAEGFPMDAEAAERHPEVFAKFKDFGDVRLYLVRRAETL